MTSNDLIVAAPWFIFAAALAAVCIRLLRSRRASRNQPGRSAPYSQIAPDRQLSAAPVLADPHWLHQVIANLLTNALKFTPAGGQVTITTRQDGPDAVLQITDTGVGIPPDDLPHIFDRFWRGRRASQISGSGIGLAIAAELAQAHRGRITAASQPGHGTTMTLTLPRA